MSNKPKNEDLERFKVTKSTFQDCLAFLNSQDIKGRDVEKMVQCKALISFMIMETSNTIEQIKQGAKPGPQQPAKVDFSVDESGLAPHKPEVK